MRAQDLDIRELLDVDPTQGIVRFAGQRAVILDAVALGLLRKQLVTSVGQGAAAATLMRFAYAHGFRMAEAMRDELSLSWDSSDELHAAGGLVHMLQGYLCLEPGSDPLSPQGATLASSYEAEQHLLHLGRSDTPVCWTLAGFASGYLSCIRNMPMLVLEDRCVGTGDAACHFRGQSLEAWGNEMHGELPFGEAGLETLWRGGEEVQHRSQVPCATARPASRGRHSELDDARAGMIAASTGMRSALALATRVARVDSTVLVTGESGTGKERVARLIHDESTRAAGPFVAVNCAAIAEPLLESELFGHARGAFTGALSDRPGLFEAASQGTLLLDEIGEMPPGMQAKLLRVIEEQKVRRVGENHSRSVDARIIAATNRELGCEVAAGRFRKDLFYRLNVVEIRLPPLRSRREDILPLARMLLARSARRMGRDLAGITPRAAERLVRHDWPGNVRELENAMEHAAILAQGQRVDLADLPAHVLHQGREAPPAPAEAGQAKTLAEIEKEHILAVLATNHGHQAQTAAALGIGVSTLYRKLRRYEADAARLTSARAHGA